MKKFQYQLIQYLHDPMTGEFVNVGIIIYNPESHYLKCKFINKYSRITQFFFNTNGHYLLKTLKHFEHEIAIHTDRLGELFTKYESLNEITNSILPKDDSALICSKIYFGIDIDLDVAMNDLFDRMINKYTAGAESEHHDDKYVWKKYYKKYFDKYGITNKLTKYNVNTLNDNFEFDKAYKNGTWNCFQTISFDLKKTDSIRSKIYKWSGILNELENIEEELHLYLLTKTPKRNKSIENLISNTFINRKFKSLTITLITHEAEANDLAQRVKKHFEETDAK